MPFLTTPVLDDFNRANVSPITGGSWSANPIWSGVPTAQIISNSMRLQTPNDGHPYWTPIFNADQEAFITLNTITDMTYCHCVARIINTNGISPSYVNIGVNLTTNGWVLEETVAGSDSTLNTATQAMSAGDSIGIQCVGTTVRGLRRASGSSDWVEVITGTVSVVNSGSIGLFIGGTTTTGAIWEDFGGGNYIHQPNPTVLQEGFFGAI